MLTPDAAKILQGNVYGWFERIEISWPRHRERLAFARSGRLESTDSVL